MVKKSAAFFCTILIILFHGGVANASSSRCPDPSLNQLLSSYDQIFEAEVEEVNSRLLQSYLPAIFDGPDFKITLKVVERYKGKSTIPKTMSFYGGYNHPDRRNFVKNRSYVFFLHNKDLSERVIQACHPVRPILANNEASTTIVTQLRDYVQRMRAQEGWLLYQEKLLMNRYESDLRAVQEILQFTVGHERRAEKLRPYQNAVKCDGIYDATANTPYFLKEFPNLSENGLYLSDRHELSEYATSFYKLGRYKDALRPLCLTQDLSAVNALHFAIATFRTHPDEPSIFEKISTKNISLSNEDLDGAALGAVDLTNADMDTVSMVGADFSESTFTKAQLKNIDADKANFEKADFRGAVVSGNLREANFAQANLRFSDFSKADIADANFKGADIRGVDFGADPDNIKDVNFEQAVFDETTLWPVGIIPKMHHAVFKKYDPQSPAELEEKQNAVRRGLMKSDKELQTNGQAEQFFSEAGRIVLDGRDNHKIQKVTLNNGRYNYIELQQGAFRHGMKRHIVSVVGDENLDVVRLDGCLDWETEMRQSRYSENSKSVKSFWYHVTKERPLIEYTTSPSSGNPLQAYLQKGLKLSFTETCQKKAIALPDTPDAVADSHGEEAQERSSDDLKELKAKLRSLEEEWAAKRRHTPDLIPSPPFPSGTKDCPARDLVFAEAGQFKIDIPKGCRRILVKAWGAGGGSFKGGTGGFTMGIVDIPEGADIDVIVGGAGEKAMPRKPRAPGGFNGGGAGGYGRPGGAKALVAGGGGRSEVLVNGTAVLIAGGGGGGSGSGPVLYGYPGGGRVPTELNTLLGTELTGQVPRNPPNRSGGLGRGGQAVIDEALPESCIPPQNGAEKNGGDGASGGDKCPFFAGSGGGAGYGGGSGGSHGRPDSVRVGGGGGGLAPEYGVTVWGGFQYHVVPNSHDLQYISLAGRANHDGMVAVIWPAPDPESFLRYATSSSSVQMNTRNGRQGLLTTAVLKKQENKVIKNYSPDNAANIYFYEKLDLSRFYRYHDTDKLSKSITILLDLMKAERLPTEFPHFARAESYKNISLDGFVLEKLDLDARRFYGVTHGTSDCTMLRDKERPNALFAPKAKDNDFTNLNCSADGTHIFLLAGQENRLKSRNGANLIFISNGNTTLELPMSQDIITFEEGFGDTTIKKACLLFPFRDAPLYATPPINTFGGTGLVFRVEEKSQQYPLVMHVFKDKPAERAGLKAGDLIVAVNGLATIGKSAEDVRSMIVGPPGEEVEFTFIRKGIPDPKVATLTREEITISPNRRDLKQVDYRYPYEWPDFIVFGKGILPEDMEWRGSALVHKNSGHSITFSEGPCFNFIFTEEGDFVLPTSDTSE